MAVLTEKEPERHLTAQPHTAPQQMHIRDNDFHLARILVRDSYRKGISSN